MSNTKSKKTKSKTGLARCMELASDRKGLIFLSALLSSLAAIASFIPVHSGLLYDSVKS